MGACILLPGILGGLYGQESWNQSAPTAGPEHDDVMKWKYFPCYWPFVRGIHRSTVNSPHKGQWRWASMFSLICVWISGWVNNREAGDLRRHRAHYDVIVMRQRVLCTMLQNVHYYINVVMYLCYYPPPPPRKKCHQYMSQKASLCRN